MSAAVLVALTGYGQLKDREKATAAGFDRHQTKPVRLQMLEGLARDVVKWEPSKQP